MSLYTWCQEELPTSFPPPDEEVLRVSRQMPTSKLVRGISKDDEQDVDFVKFFRIVQKAASGAGCVFFLWSPECHDGPVGDIWCEDLSGWLIPEVDADAFERLWAARDDVIWDNEYNDVQAFARWSEGENHEVVIDFEFPLKGIYFDD